MCIRDSLVCDEAQFYTDPQVEQLARVVDELNVDVYAFGLLTDFRGKLFPGSARLLELADERMELQVPELTPLMHSKHVPPLGRACCTTVQYWLRRDCGESVTLTSTSPTTWFQRRM